MPTVTAPMKSGGSPRDSSWKAARPRSRAHQASCRSMGRAKSTAISPLLTRSAISIQPNRAMGGQQRLAEPDVGRGQLLVVTGERTPADEMAANRMPTLMNLFIDRARQDRQPIRAESPELRRRQHQVGAHSDSARLPREHRAGPVAAASGWAAAISPICAPGVPTWRVGGAGELDWISDRRVKFLARHTQLRVGGQTIQQVIVAAAGLAHLQSDRDRVFGDHFVRSLASNSLPDSRDQHLARGKERQIALQLGIDDGRERAEVLQHAEERLKESVESEECISATRRTTEHDTSPSFH